MTTKLFGKNILIAAALVVIVVIAYSVLQTPDRRSGGQKISDAINELPNGVDKAARQLEDRTPADKLNDAAKDAGDDIKKATNHQ
jgi:cell division protein FtsL